MFECKDKNGQNIYPDDTVQATITDLAGETSVIGFVSVIFSETDLQIIPTEGASSLPVEAKSSNCVVLKSLIADIENLKTQEDFQNILREAEVRYLRGQTDKPKKSSGKTAKPKIEGPDLSDI